MVELPAAELEPSRRIWPRTIGSGAPGAVLLSGPATVTIEEWMAPTLGPGRTTPTPRRTGRSGGPASLPTAWTPRSADRPDPRVRGPRQEPAARARGGRARQHLVHRHPEGRYRPAGSEDRPVASTRSWSRARADRTRRSWTGGAATCSSRCSRGTSAGSTRQRRNGDQEDAERQHLPLRHPSQFAGRAVVRGLPGQPHRQCRSEDDGDQGVHAPNADARPRRLAITRTT